MEGKHSQIWEVYRGLSVCPRMERRKKRELGRDAGKRELRERIERRKRKRGVESKERKKLKEKGRWWKGGENVAIFDCAALACLRIWRPLLNWILFLLFINQKKPHPFFPWKICTKQILTDAFCSLLKTEVTYLLLKGLRKEKNFKGMKEVARWQTVRRKK